MTLGANLIPDQRLTQALEGHTLTDYVLLSWQGSYHYVISVCLSRENKNKNNHTQTDNMDIARVLEFGLLVSTNPSEICSFLHCTHLVSLSSRRLPSSNLSSRLTFLNSETFTLPPLPHCPFALSPSFFSSLFTFFSHTR